MKELFRISFFAPCGAPEKPGRVTLAEKKELAMDRFGIKFTFPPIAVTSLGVTGRELSVMTGPAEPVVKVYPPDVQLSDEYEFDVNASVVVQVRDTDAAGNWSPPSTPLQFVVTDDVPPETPGAPNVGEKRQIS